MLEGFTVELEFRVEFFPTVTSFCDTGLIDVEPSKAGFSEVPLEVFFSKLSIVELSLLVFVYLEVVTSAFPKLTLFVEEDSSLVGASKEDLREIDLTELLTGVVSALTSSDKGPSEVEIGP